MKDEAEHHDDEHSSMNLTASLKQHLYWSTWHNCRTNSINLH